MDQPSKSKSLSLNEILDEIARQDVGLLEDIETALAEVARMVWATHKKGSVALTISLEHTGRGVAVSAVVIGRPPKYAPVSTTFFVGQDGALQREDESQMDLVSYIQDQNTDRSRSRSRT